MGLFVMLELEPTRQNLFCALADMEVAKAYLRAQGASAYQIKIAPIWPYHTPVLIQYKELRSAYLEGIRPQPTTKPCYLATLGRVVPAGTILLWDHWLRPHRNRYTSIPSFKAAISDGYSVMTPIGAFPSYLSRSAQKRTFAKVGFMPFFKVGTPELETFTTTRQQLAALRLTPRRAMHYQLFP
jgi:hypothetical protein